MITTSLEDANKEFVADENFIRLLDKKFITRVRNSVINFFPCILLLLTLIHSFDWQVERKSPILITFPKPFKNRIKRYVDDTLYRNIYSVELVQLYPTILHIVSVNSSDRKKATNIQSHI